MNILKYIIKTVKYLVIAVMLVIFCSNFYLMIMSAANPGTHPAVLGFSSAVVISGSMEPEINIDDLVIIKKQKSYSTNDIIAFTTGKSFVTHRIIEEKDNGFVTKGDANNAPDKAIIQPEAISGQVVYVVPGVGNIITFLKSPLGMMLIVLFGFAVMAV